MEKENHEGPLSLTYRFVKDEMPDLWLLHGYTESSEYLRSIFKSELANNFNIYIPDLPGFGKSKYSSSDDLTNLCEILSKLIKKYSANKAVYLFGHSLGGTIGTMISSRNDINVVCFINVDGLLLAESEGTSSLSYVNSFPDPLEYKNFVIGVFKKKARTDFYLRRYIDNIRNTNEQILYDWSKVIIDWLKDDKIARQYAELKCRKIYIFGNKSINERNRNYVIKRGFNMKELNDMGHWPMLEDPDFFWREIQKQLSHLRVECNEKMADQQITPTSNITN